jgi:uncharacterized membrane protein YeaQ/YmgE (transglycosylase-associated protein family)
MNLIAWIILGLLAGAIAKMIYPGTQGGGFIATMFLGIIRPPAKVSTDRCI